MWLRLLFLMCLMGGAGVVAQGQWRWQSCLPPDLKADDVISNEPGVKSGVERQITVKEKLKQLGARCRNGRLVDAKGRQVHFYRLTGCWGNPPENYQEIMDNQRRELTRLKRRYRVVEISCNPSGVMLQ